MEKAHECYHRKKEKVTKEKRHQGYYKKRDLTVITGTETLR